MNIAIVGYGKMGKQIEKYSIKRGHKVLSIIDKNSSFENINGADVAINFCTPETASKNIEFCLKNRVSVVSGTTGWVYDLQNFKKLTKETKTSFIHSSNFSLGMNLFFNLNNKLAKMMNTRDYDLSIEETHHKMKKDKPSGSAITLAKDIISFGKFNNWSPTAKENSIPVNSIRIGNGNGEHIVKYSSDTDLIEIRHLAKKRKGFAIGAILAAEWIIDKKGVFTMNDIINDLNI